jgi:type IV secretory pathway component VirB8
MGIRRSRKDDDIDLDLDDGGNWDDFDFEAAEVSSHLILALLVVLFLLALVALIGGTP